MKLLIQSKVYLFRNSGEFKERHSLIMTMLFCSAIALLSLSFTSNIWWLLFSSLLVGLTSITQMLIVNTPFSGTDTDIKVKELLEK